MCLDLNVLMSDDPPSGLMAQLAVIIHRQEQKYHNNK